MSWAINQDCRDANGILSDIVAVSKQLVANGPPDNADGINGNVYTDALTGQQYQKQNGEWVLTVDLPAVSGGGVVYTSGDGITVFQDDPSPGFATVNMNQNIQTFGATGEIPYASPAGDGASVVVRKITNNDGSLVVSSDVSGAISIDNNTLIDAVQAVGLPAYSEINRKIGNTHEVQRLGSGSNIAITSDFVNGCLIATQPNVSHNSVDITASLNGSQSITTNQQLVSDNGSLEWQDYTKSIQETIKDVKDGTGFVWGGNDETNPAEGTAYVLYSTSGTVRLKQITAKIIDSTNYTISSGSMTLQIGYIPQGSATNDANFNLIWEGGIPTGQVNPQLSFDFSQLVSPLPPIPNLSALAFRISKTNVVISSGDDKAECTVHLIYN